MNTTKMLLTIILTGMTLFLANCSKSSNSGSSNTNGSCSTGQVYTTQYGCLPTEYCAARGYTNYGYNASTQQCIIGSTYNYNNGTTNGTCQTGYVPVNSTCLPTAQCTQMGYSNYGFVQNGSTGQWACYPPNYNGGWIF